MSLAVTNGIESYTAKLRAIAFPLETCSSPINAKHIGGTNEKKIMT